MTPPMIAKVEGNESVVVVDAGLEAELEIGPEHDGPGLDACGGGATPDGCGSGG